MYVSSESFNLNFHPDSHLTLVSDIRLNERIFLLEEPMSGFSSLSSHHDRASLTCFWRRTYFLRSSCIVIYISTSTRQWQCVTCTDWWCWEHCLQPPWISQKVSPCQTFLDTGWLAGFSGYLWQESSCSNMGHTACSEMSRYSLELPAKVRKDFTFTRRLS